MSLFVVRAYADCVKYKDFTVEANSHDDAEEKVNTLLEDEDPLEAFGWEDDDAFPDMYVSEVKEMPDGK